MTRRLLTIASAIICLAIIIFIFSNSMDNAAQSTEKSDAVYKAVNEVAKSLGAKKEISKSFIRQSAHFLEFAALGVFSALTLTFSIAPSPREKLSRRLYLISFALPFCALIAFIDENIQKFSAGRVFDPEDILTDTCGSLSGIILVIAVFLLIHLCLSLKRKKQS